ncbi:general substrate transporter [Roridomyces roridus]|uniref:General substrate transporter n=1 Tax=Roridomyces roridus TaxID=1738132 RepID=A0AAD7BZJ9_9AGAR|nr:general substrate transporter [Roridomyces roridus]
MVSPIGLLKRYRPKEYIVRYPRAWSGNFLLYISGSMASLGDALHGYSQGITAGFQVQPNFMQHVYGIHVSEEEMNMDEAGVHVLLPAVLVSALTLTALLSALLSAYISDYMGRRMSMRIGALIYIVASVIQMFAPNFQGIIVGRLIQGFGTGILSTAVPIYQCEIAPAKRRGMFISLETLWMTVGYSASSWLGYLFFFEKRNDDSWRGPFGIQALVAVLLFGWSWLLPETPRWLIANGFKNEAMWTLADLHADGDPTDPEVEQSFSLILAAIEKEQENGRTAPWSDLFKTKDGMLRRTIMAWTAQMFGQLNGINALLHFLPETLMHSGFTVPQALFYSAICSISYLLGTIPALVLVDGCGRRPFLLAGSAALALALIIIGSLRLCNERWPDRIDILGGAHGIVASMSVYFAVFASTWGPVPWILSAELFSTKYRAKGMAVATVADWLFDFIVAFWTPPLLEAMRGGYYFYLAGFCIISWIVVYFVFVETGTDTLEEVEGMFESVKSAEVEECFGVGDDGILDLRRRRHVEGTEQDKEEQKEKEEKEKIKIKDRAKAKAKAFLNWGKGKTPATPVAMTPAATHVSRASSIREFFHGRTLGPLGPFHHKPANPHFFAPSQVSLVSVVEEAEPEPEISRKQT